MGRISITISIGREFGESDFEATNKRNDHTMNANSDFDADLQSELDAALGDMDLFDLVDSAEPARRPSDEGNDVRRGTVVAVQRDEILVEMGQKSTGMLPVRQLGDQPIPEIGDVIEVAVLGFNKDEGLLILARKDAVMAASWETLQVGQSVEGVVTGHNKGGIEIKINGIPAFMPISQIDIKRIESEDLGAFVNQKMRCQVMEYRRSEKKLVVSRRASLKVEEEKAREVLFETLTEGQRVSGKVRTIMPYGAFVDIGGADGLLHVRDMGHGRVEDPNEVVKVDQELDLMVLRIDREEKKIALGLKQIMADPWDDAANKWPVNSLISARVVRLMDFGAFVELAEGVEGLVPISEMSLRRIGHPREVVSENDVVELRILSMDLDRKRIALSIKGVGEDPWVGASVRWPTDSITEGTVTRATEFGAFVELTEGVEGLIHISELSADRVQSVGEVVRAGETVKVKVLSVDEEDRRISLSIKAITDSPDYTGEPTESAEPEKPKRKRKKPLKGGLDW